MNAAVDSLIWHEVVVALLMDGSAHFEGFGQFEYDSEREIVRFKASPVISALEPPEIEPDETALGDALAFCNREVRNPGFVEMSWESAAREPRRMDLAGVYANALVRQAITSRPPRTVSEIAAILAATAYFSWLIAFAITLRDAGTVRIANIGRSASIWTWWIWISRAN